MVTEHGLSDRKMKILHAVIKNYLETGEPVGSRTISKYTELKLSSATIRNEMSDLEEMGYIIQPHTSAGRIPSDKGYRFYVDQIMQEKEQEVTEVKALMIKRVDRVELILKKLARLLANNTNYAAMITGPQYHHNKLKFIQLSQMDPHKLLVVTVVEGNLIRNKVIHVQEEISQEEILNLNIIFRKDFTLLNIILPLVISFYTFQQLSFLIDTYRGETSDYSFWEYTAFVTFFPQLVAGPIVLHSEIIPQFRDRAR